MPAFLFDKLLLECVCKRVTTSKYRSIERGIADEKDKQKVQDNTQNAFRGTDPICFNFRVAIFNICYTNGFSQCAKHDHEYSIFSVN